jgi:MYXO-CTERM domain-containing protein
MNRAGLVTLGIVLCISDVARANGAFPMSFSIFAPKDVPHRLLLSTNFGLIISEDDGATWRLVCEAVTTNLAFLYSVGPSAMPSYFALGVEALVTSSDQGCSWTKSTGADPVIIFDDVFPDPNDPARVFMIAQEKMPPYHFSLYESADRGRTFLTKRFTAPESWLMNSIESARTSSSTIYATGFVGGPSHVAVFRSTDGGRSFATLDVTAQTSSRSISIAAVDPEDDRRIYFRIPERVALQGDALGISTDGGRTIRIALRVAGSMSGFLRSASGALYVATSTGAFKAPALDGAFSRWPTGAMRPKIGSFAERSGVLYVSTDNNADGFAVASTKDDGATFTPLFRYDRIAGPLDCPEVQSACAAAACLVMSPDGGASDCGVVPAPPAEPGPVADTKPKGCACSARAVDHASDRWLGLAVIAFLLLGARRRRRVEARGRAPGDPRRDRTDRRGGPSSRTSRTCDRRLRKGGGSRAARGRRRHRARGSASHGRSDRARRRTSSAATPAP